MYQNHRSGANGHASTGKPLQVEAGTDAKVEDVPFRSAMPSMPAREDTASSLTTAEYVQVGADKYHMVNSGLMVSARPGGDKGGLDCVYSDAHARWLSWFSC